MINKSTIIDLIFYYGRCLFNLLCSPTPLLPYSQLYNKYSTGFDITPPNLQFYLTISNQIACKILPLSEFIEKNK
ncbi:MAG: hypothetical protein SWX82_02935 [Cyanobacteriota bacterium]|nr:hypothetical protein [Cyanobacteriota bacterium]